DAPDNNGHYQFPLTAKLNFFEFDDRLVDASARVVTHETAVLTSRVFVQVHNRGVLAASSVRVTLLLAEAAGGPIPDLPAGYATQAQNGTAIAGPDWRVVGSSLLNSVTAPLPRIAAFDLTSDLLPKPSALAGHAAWVVLALVHHSADAFTATETHV